MAKQFDIVFNEGTGKFVVHFSGVATHSEEHELLDRLLQELKSKGFDFEVEHFHDRPKIPELESGRISEKEKNGGVS